jgi:hypothetical protein
MRLTPERSESPHASARAVTHLHEALLPYERTPHASARAATHLHAALLLYDGTPPRVGEGGYASPRSALAALSPKRRRGRLRIRNDRFLLQLTGVERVG